MPFLTVLGHTNIDVQLRVETLPSAGASSPILDRRTVHGGTACNIARHAAGLGVPTRLWSRVGPDMPPDWRDALLADGVELAFDVVRAGRTPTCFIFTDATGEQAYCMDQGAMTPPYAPPASVLEDLDGWLHVSTGDPAAYLPLVKQAKGAGLRVAFDPGQEIHFAYDTDSLQALLDQADVFFCNEAELDRTLRFLAYGDAVQLLDHTDTVIVTRGADGVDLVTDQGRLHIPALPAQAVDPTGAGDALRAGAYAGLHAGFDWPAALQCGVEAATRIVAVAGPQSVTVGVADVPSLGRTS